jgi:hypothetical protein
MVPNHQGVMQLRACKLSKGLPGLPAWLAAFAMSFAMSFARPLQSSPSGVAAHLAR